VFQNIAEPSSQALQLVRGDLDIALNLSHDHAARIARMTSATAKFSPQAAIFFLQLNTSPAIGGPFANPKVQQAIRHALDYEGLLAIGGQGAQALSSLLPSVFPGALEPRFPFATDRAKARALLREAGVGDVSGKITHYQATLSGVEVTLLAQKIQADLRAIGIQMDLNSLPPPIAVQEWRAGRVQVGLFRWVADFPDPSNYLIFLPGGNVGQRVHWLPSSSPAAAELAKMGDAAESEMDPRRRAGAYQRLQRRLVEIGPFIPLFQPTVPFAYRTNLQNVTYHSVWGVDYYPVTRI
jgi:peptide/nickel transport system substrate-binding protein